MNTAIAATTSSSSTMRAIQAVVAAGLVCGTLDGISALVVYRVPWMRLFQSIAFGALGPESFKGGMKTAVLGIVFHYTVAFGATIVFFMTSRFLPALVDRALLFGPLYGLCVHLVMQFVVVPMSLIGRRPFTWRAFLTGLAVHMIVVGPSIALTLRSVLRRA